MHTLSTDHGEKIRAMRKAEGMTQNDFAEALGIGLGTIKNFETGQRGVGSAVLDKVANHPQFTKYTLWLMTGSIAPEIGQISPDLSPDGPNNTSDHREGRKVG